LKNSSIADYLKKILNAKFSKYLAEDRSVAGSNPASWTFMWFLDKSSTTGIQPWREPL